MKSPETKKISRLVRFGITIRKETMELVDKMANEQNRSRSSMIDVLCYDAIAKIKEAKKPS